MPLTFKVRFDGFILHENANNKLMTLLENGICNSEEFFTILASGMSFTYMESV